MKRGFTLIELLVVIAIIAILAAILFPVFAQAKVQAKKTVSISNNKQLSLATLMYMNDADDKFMPWGYDFTYIASPPDNDEDQLQMIYPYIKNEAVMVDPMDPATSSDRLDADGDLTNPNTVPAQYQSAQALLNWAAVADWGLNVQYVQPAYIDGTGNLVVTTLSQTQIVRPAQTYMALSSIWGRRASGAPYGGGNAGVDPPCVYLPDGTDTRPGWSNSYIGWYWYGTWVPDQPLAWNEFGGVWPWYNSGSMVIASFNDGHAKALQLGSLTAGCNVQDYWAGYITNESLYNWSTTF